MHDLAARCEAAEGPDRTLDVEIAVALKIAPRFDPSIYIVPLEYRPYDRSGWVAVDAVHPNGERHCCHAREVPRYSASVDAALTLIPDGMWWLIGKGRTRPDEPLYGVQILDGERVVAEAETESSVALAICAAALRARAVGKDS